METLLSHEATEVVNGSEVAQTLAVGNMTTWQL